MLAPSTLLTLLLMKLSRLVVSPRLRLRATPTKTRMMPNQGKRQSISPVPKAATPKRKLAKMTKLRAPRPRLNRNPLTSGQMPPPNSARLMSATALNGTIA